MASPSLTRGRPGRRCRFRSGSGCSGSGTPGEACAAGWCSRRSTTGMPESPRRPSNRRRVRRCSGSSSGDWSIRGDCQLAWRGTTGGCCCPMATGPQGSEPGWALRRAGVARRTTARHWPAVKARLDAGVPAALGVVTVGSANPLLLGANHQVLAYGYETAGSSVILHVYDPNVGPDDSVMIRWDTAAEPAAFEHNLGLRLPVRGFFLTRYRPARPPGVRSRQLRGRRAAGTPSC